MKSLKYLSVAAIATAALAAGSAFADQDNAQDGMNPNTQSGSGMHQRFDGDHGQRMGNRMLEQYLRTDLSDTEKSALQTLEQSHRDAMKALFQNAGSGTVDQTSVKALQDQYITSVLPYIATDKQDAFKQSFANMPKMETNRSDRNEWNKGSDDNKKARSSVEKAATVLPAEVATALDNKLATIASDSEKLTWLAGVNTKIDALSARITAQKSKDLLAALKDLINTKIDALNNNSVDTATVNSLLQ